MPPIGPHFIRNSLPGLLLVFLLAGLPLSAQTSTGIIPRPEDSILDDSRLLTVDTRDRLREAIAEAGASGLRVGFAASTLLPRPTLAGELREEWFPGDPDAIMIVYSRDLDRFLVSDAREEDPLYHGFPATQAITMANGALARLNRDRDGRDPIVAAEAANLILSLARLAREAEPSTGWSDAATMIAIWIGAAAVLCLPIYLLLRGARGSGVKPHPLVFPEVAVAPRLGAMNGGITGAEIRITAPAKGEELRAGREERQTHH